MKPFECLMKPLRNFSDPLNAKVYPFRKFSYLLNAKIYPFTELSHPLNALAVAKKIRPFKQQTLSVRNLKRLLK